MPQKRPWDSKGTDADEPLAVPEQEEWVEEAHEVQTVEVNTKVEVPAAANKSFGVEITNMVAAEKLLSEMGVTPYLKGSGRPSLDSKIELEVPADKLVKVAAQLLNRKLSFEFTPNGRFSFFIK